MYDKFFSIGENKSRLDKSEFESQLNFALEVENEMGWVQPIGQKRNWIEVVKFFISDYFTYTKGRLLHSISRVTNFLNSGGFSPDKVLKHYYVRAQTKSKTGKLRRLFFLLGIEQDPSKQKRSVKNVKRAGFLSLEQSKLPFIGAITTSHHPKRYPNLKKNLKVSRPEQLWIADITKLATKEGQKYFYIITDAYCNQVMGYSISEKLGSSNAVIALKMALGKRKYYEDLIHHSKDGIHYCLPQYKQLLIESNIHMSASEL